MRRPLFRSRLALAASVTLLFFGSLSFSWKSSGEAEPRINLAGKPVAADRVDDPVRALRRHGDRGAGEGKVEGHLSLEQPKDGPTMIKIEFELPPAK